MKFEFDSKFRIKNSKFLLMSFSKFFLIFILIAAWLYSGFPQIWHNPPFPPEIQEAQAATYTETYSTAGNFTWTAPPGIATATVECWGGGGGGGLQPNSGGGGGGGGAYAASTVSVTPGTDYAVVVGAGGARDIAGSGGDSTFNSTTVVAKGGTNTTSTVGGAGGTGSTGQVTSNGGAGGAGTGTGDISGGGGGAGGPAGAGVTGSDFSVPLSGAGGNGGAGNAGSGGTGGTGGNAAVGQDGSPHATGGGGGGGGDDGTAGGNGGAPGGGGGGGEAAAGGTGAAGQIKITYTIFTILGNAASEPSNATIGPGGSITDLDNFTFQNTTSTDTVTALVVTLGPAGAYNNISQVDITDTSDVAKCTAVTGLTSNTVSFTTCSIAVTTTQTTYKVRITPKSHTSMPPPSSGASYDTTGTVTSYTSTNVQTGSDTGSATITVDNLSPNGATVTSGSAGDTQVTLNWTTSNSSDFSRSVVLRWAASTPGSEVPAEGTDYSVDGTITTATVACVRTADAASTAVSGTDGAGTGGCSAVALTNDQAYSYKVFQKDSNGNYDVGVTFTGSPFTPAAAASTLSFSITNNSVGFGTWTNTNKRWANSATTGAEADPGAGEATQLGASTNSTSGLVITVRSQGNGATAGLYKSTATVYLIEAVGPISVANATEGYAVYGANASLLTVAVGFAIDGTTLLTTSAQTFASAAAAVSGGTVDVKPIAGITSVTPAGSYADTLTFICTGTF